MLKEGKAAVPFAHPIELNGILGSDSILLSSLIMDEQASALANMGCAASLFVFILLFNLHYLSPFFLGELQPICSFQSCSPPGNRKRKGYETS